MKIVQKFREQMTGFLQVCQGEFDNYTAVLSAWSQVEHNDDGTHPANVGNLLSVLAGENLGQGQPVYVSAGQNSTGPGQAYLANGAAVATSTHAVVVGVATQSYQAGATAVIRCRNVQTGYVGLVPGMPYYVGTTSGSLTATKPTNAVLVGLAINSTDLLLTISWPTTLDTNQTLTFSGVANGTVTMSSGTAQYFTTVGTYTITVSSRLVLTFTGVSAGGAGINTDGTGGAYQNGGGGGGGGCYSSGTTVTLVPTSTYTLVVPAAATSGNNGSNLTLSGTTEGTIISLQGGRTASAQTGGAGGASGSSTGSNLVSGGAGGTGGTEATGTPDSTAGTASSGAGGGGGGGSADNTRPARVGGNGLNESGQSVQPTTGGHGGGVDFNGTKCGGGGGGATNNNSNNVLGQNSEQGGCAFTA